VHKYKNDLQNFKAGFEEMLNAKAARRASIANKHVLQIRLLLGEIRSDMTTRRTRVDINELVRNALHFYEVDPKNAGIRFERKLDRGLPALDAREGEIRAIIDNLVSNAIKAIRRAGRKDGLIAVATSRVRANDIECLELSVADNGSGIKNEDRNKIYNRGYTTFDGGTGEGLFMTRRIVQATFGGTIHLVSAVDQGTTFFVRIPLRRNEWTGGT
jgi:signal transduction histidine kinase